MVGVGVVDEAAPGVYVPRNRPAIGNLMTEFNFRSPHFGTLRLAVRAEPPGAWRR